MSIPYNENLSLNNYQTKPDWNKGLPLASWKYEDQTRRAAGELYALTFKGPFRTVQFIRDFARLVLKVPIRAIANPICLKKNWQEKERAIVNTKLPGYSLVQLISVPVKFIVALIALATSVVFQDLSKWILNKSERWTSHLDGRASQLEALKEEGAKKAQSRKEFEDYRTWLYNIKPSLCRKMVK